MTETELDDLRYPIGRFMPLASSMPGIRAAQIQTLRAAARSRCARPCRTQRRAARHALSRRRLDGAPGGASRCRQPRQLLRPLQAGAHRGLAHHQALRRGSLGQTRRQRAARRCFAGADRRRCTRAGWRCWSPCPRRISRRAITHPEHGRQNLANVLAIYDWHSPPPHRAHHQSARAAGLVGAVAHGRRATKRDLCSAAAARTNHRSVSGRPSAPRRCSKTGACSSTCARRATR